MSFQFTGDGQGATVTTVTTLPFVEEMRERGITSQTAVSGSSGSLGEFAVPVGPGRIVGTDTFVNPDAPYISLYDARRQEFPTKTNVELKQELVEMKAKDPEAYLEFMKMMEKSGYDDVDEMFQGAAIAKMDVNEFLAQRASSGLFGGGGGSGGPTTTVTTNESNRGQAYQTINPQFEQGLGRQITADELTEFRDMLNKFERENPYITNSGKGYSKTTGGFNPAELSKAFVQGQEGYAEAQVAMNFMGVLDKILKNPDSLGETLQERMN